MSGQTLDVRADTQDCLLHQGQTLRFGNAAIFRKYWTSYLQKIFFHMKQDILRILKQGIGYLQKTNRSKAITQAIFRILLGQTQ